MKDTVSRRSIALPLGALVISWGIYLGARYTDLFVTGVYDDDGTYLGQEPPIQASVYLIFGAVAVFALSAVIAQRMAISHRVVLGAHERLPRAAHRFATLSIVVALGFAAILGVSVFLQGFNTYGPRSDDLGLRFATTYLPIILYTSLVVAVLLIGFVLRKDTLPKTDDKAQFSIDAAQDSTDLPEARKSLGAAYALPIVAVAVALIFGLIVFDVTGTNLEVWVWVIIQVMIGAGIVIGTIFGEKAVAAGPSGASSRSRITRAARGLNFVLSIVFGAVVSLMGFAYGSTAVADLRISPSFSIDIYAAPGTGLANTPLGVNGWDLAPGTEVVVTLEPGGIEIVRGEVDAFNSFYKDTTLPSALAPGQYVLEGLATGRDGVALTKTIEFGVAENGTLIWNEKAQQMMRFGEQDFTVMTPSLSWFLDDLLPALVLVLLAQLGIFLSLTERNKRRDPRSE